MDGIQDSMGLIITLLSDYSNLLTMQLTTNMTMKRAWKKKRAWHYRRPGTSTPLPPPPSLIPLCVEGIMTAINSVGQSCNAACFSFFT
jgi:hypothetical protein